MKAKTIVITVIVIILAAIAGISIYRSQTQSGHEPTVVTVSGTVKDVAPGADTITLETTDGNFTVLTLDASTVLMDESGAAVEISDIVQGMSLQASGTTTPTSIIPSTVKIVSRPPQGTDIAAPCPGIITEDNNSISCRMPITSRITISLPSAQYSKGDLAIDPKSAMGETFGASTQDDRWVRTFEAMEPGTVTITVPSSDKAVSSFKATFTIFGTAPAAPNSGTSADAGTNSEDDSAESGL